jgi:nucleoside phosphorylase
VANKNQVPCLILRGVTDLVGAEGGEAYNGNIEVFYSNTELIMKTLLDSLSNWILIFYQQKIRN